MLWNIWIESLPHFSNDHFDIGLGGLPIPLLCLSSSDLESISEMFFLFYPQFSRQTSWRWMLRPQVCSLPPNYRTLLHMSLFDGLQAFKNQGAVSEQRVETHFHACDYVALTLYCLLVLSFSVLLSLFLLSFLPLPNCSVVLRIASESSLLIRIPWLWHLGQVRFLLWASVSQSVKWQGWNHLTLISLVLEEDE